MAAAKEDAESLALHNDLRLAIKNLMVKDKLQDFADELLGKKKINPVEHEQHAKRFNDLWTLLNQKLIIQVGVYEQLRSILGSLGYNDMVIIVEDFTKRIGLVKGSRDMNDADAILGLPTPVQTEPSGDFEPIKGHCLAE